MHERIDTIPTPPARPPEAHKGTFGRVGVVGGSAADTPRMIGAPALSALGAVRAGAGLVRIAAPGPILDAVLTAAPFATGSALPTLPDGSLDAAPAAACFDRLLSGSDAVVVGPGMGRSHGARAVVLRTVLQEDAPAVVDADALNLLTEIPEFWREIRATLILTPHPGEARRLLEALSMRGDPAGDDDQRLEVAFGLARRLGAIVVLKGRGTVVTDGLRAWVCRAGNPVLSTGGTGDVLAGVIAGLVAQSRGGRGPDLFGCAQIGVQAHATAADAWVVEQHASGGMTPTDLADRIPAAIERLRSPAQSS